MTEKRFNMEYVYGNPTIWHITDNGEHIVDVKICDLLNELNDENEKLKTQLMEKNCDNCKYSKAIYADVECRKKGLTEWKCNCDEFNGDFE